MREKSLFNLLLKWRISGFIRTFRWDYGVLFVIHLEFDGYNGIIGLMWELEQAKMALDFLSKKSKSSLLRKLISYRKLKA